MASPQSHINHTNLVPQTVEYLQPNLRYLAHDNWDYSDIFDQNLEQYKPFVDFDFAERQLAQQLLVPLIKKLTVTYK